MNAAKSLPIGRLELLLERQYQTTALKVPTAELRHPDYETVRDAIHQVLSGHEEIGSKADLDALCGEIEDQLEAMEESVDAGVLSRVRARLKQIGDQIKDQMGWRRKRLVEKRGGREVPTEACVEAARLLQQSLFPELLLDESDDEHDMTAAELRDSLALYQSLGEVALAEYWSVVASDRFSYNAETIQNLRSYLGDIEITGGGVPIEEIPVELFQNQSLRFLRQLLFNRKRDEYFTKFYKDEATVDRVLEELGKEREAATHVARQKFIGELEDYFMEVENLRPPQRLKKSVGTGKKFPAQHQRVAVIEVKKQRQMLLADGVGSGKTGEIIQSFEHLREEGQTHKALIICPASVLGEWEKRLDSKEGYFEKGQEPVVAIIHPGNPSERWKEWKKAFDHADYVVMSYSMSRRKTAINDEAFAAQLGVAVGTEVSHEELAKRINADFMAIDEAHYLRNAKGADSERIYNISQCDSIKNGYLVAASATPIFNTMSDIAALLRLLNANQERLKGEGLEGVDFTNVEQLSRAISRSHPLIVRNFLSLRMLRRDTEECLPVGTELLQEEPLLAELSPWERAVYDAIVEDPFWSPTDKIRELWSICAFGGKGFVEEQGSMRALSKYKQIKGSIGQDFEELGELGRPSGKIVYGMTGFARGVTRDRGGNGSGRVGSNDPATSDTKSYLVGELRNELEQQGVKVFVLDGTNSGSTPLKKKKKKMKADEGSGPDNWEIKDIDGATLTETRRIIAAFRDHDGPAVLFARTDIIGVGMDLSFVDRMRMALPTTLEEEETQFVGRGQRKGRKTSMAYRRLFLSDTIEQGMWEYAARKSAIAHAILLGRPLTREEEEIMNEEPTHVRRGGFIAYDAKSPREKVMYIFHCLFGSGKERIREFFARDEGKFAQDLARHYAEDEELSHAGNNRRAILALVKEHLTELQSVADGGTVQLADVAAGTMALARSLRDRTDIQVASSDICGAMLEMGKQLYERDMPPEASQECSMDELPYADGSKDVVVHSLAMHYSRHNRHKMDGGGSERIRALCEINRVLKTGGLAFISLPPGLFGETEEFDRFAQTVAKLFGFEIVQQHTGQVVSADHQDEEQFSGYVLTLKKTGEPETMGMERDDWVGLRFPRRPRLSTNGTSTHKPRGRGDAPPPGAYHEKFEIKGAQVEYLTPDANESAKQEHGEQKAQYQRVQRRIDVLLAEHGSFEKIPTALLLSISLEDVDAVEQGRKDEYFRALMRRYGSIEAIPIDEISAESPVVLYRSPKTKKGVFLCLAHLDKHGKVRGGYGKRYFFEEEFRDPPSAAVELSQEPSADDDEGDGDEAAPF